MKLDPANFVGTESESLGFCPGNFDAHMPNLNSETVQTVGQERFRCSLIVEAAGTKLHRNYALVNLVGWKTAALDTTKTKFEF